MISVITPTVRPEGLVLVAKALKRQTYKDFEWIVMLAENIATPDSKHAKTLKAVEDVQKLKYMWDPPKKKGDYWAIYKAYNKAVRRAKGDLIISLQDYTYIKPDALEKMWYHYTQEPKTIITGVGNKYVNDEFVVQTWKDPRERDDQGSFYGCFFNDIEINFASFPKAAFYAVGGFDESLDKWSSACGLDVLARLDMLGGWDFKIDQTNKSYSLEHGRIANWEEKNPFKNGVWIEKASGYRKQPILKYLK